VANCDAGSTAIIPNSTDTQSANVGSPFSNLPPVTTTVDITAASQSGTTTTYTYTLIRGPALRAGMSVTISGMNDAGNNGTFSISAVGTGTFNVENASGVAATGQSGTGTVTVPPPQNPVFVLTGP